MREIKFRVWHKKRNKYYEVHHLHCGAIGVHNGDWATCKARDCIEYKDMYIQIQPAEAILEQYTGLKDNNGKEAYQSDLFKAASQHIYEIAFEDGAFGYHGPIDGDFIPLKHLIDSNIGWEIIGNIHDDPELLS